MVSKRDCCVRGWEQWLPCLMNESRALSRLVRSDLGVRRVRFSPEVITLAVRWYLRFGLSYCEVEELGFRLDSAIPTLEVVRTRGGGG
jgi:hypothetical protein